MPNFDLVSMSLTIADYCQMLERKEVTVNRDYQRSDKVWPQAAQSFLIETILLGYPMPKLSLHQRTDIKTRRTVKEIVDGQQRTRTIQSFYEGALRLTRTQELGEFAGLAYSDLPDELKQTFLEYSLSIDLFTGATSEEIREVFRRINSYTVPLNPEEHRHATYQGEMKWFIYDLSRAYDTTMLRLGSFTEGRIVRMADAKLYSEITHACNHGISTTNKRSLDRLYRDNNADFPQRDDMYGRFETGLDVLLKMEDLHKGPLMKPHVIYSLILAIMHYLQPIPSLEEDIPSVAHGALDLALAVPILSELAEALSDEEHDEQFISFVKASQTKTNVRKQRITRVQSLYMAMAA